MFNIVDNNDGCQREIFVGLQKYKNLCSNFHRWIRLHAVLSQDELCRHLMMYCRHTNTIIKRKGRPNLKANRVFYNIGCHFASQKFAKKSSFKEQCPLRVLVSTKPGSSVFKIEAVNLIHNHVKIDDDFFPQIYLEMLRIPFLFSTNKMQEISSSSYETKMSCKVQKDMKRDNFDNQEHQLIVRKEEKMNRDSNMIEEGPFQDIKIIRNDANIDQGMLKYPMNCQNNGQSEHNLIRIMECKSVEASNGIMDPYLLSCIDSPIRTSLEVNARLIIENIVTALILRLNQRK